MKPGVHQFEDKLLDFAYGELQPHEAEAVDAHVRGCSKCSESLSNITSVRSQMRALPVEPAPMAGLESLLAYADQHAKNNAKPKRLVPLWRKLLIPLSTVMALTTVGVVAIRASEMAPPDVSGVAFKKQEQAPAPVVVAVAPKEKEAAVTEELAKRELAAAEKEQSKVIDAVMGPKAATVVPATPAPKTANGDEFDAYASMNSGAGIDRKKSRADAQPSKIVEAKPQPSDGLFGLRGSSAAVPKGGARSLKDAPANNDKKSLEGEAVGGLAQGYAQGEPETPMAEQYSAKPPPSPSPVLKKPSMNLGTKGGGVASPGTATGNKLESKRDREEGLGLDTAAASDDERQAVRSRVGKVFEDQLSMARAANTRGDRQAEIKECLSILSSGAQGAQRAESLKRVCDAYDAMGEPDQAQPYCDALAQEFGQTTASKQMVQRRSAEPSASKMAKKKAAPTRQTSDQQPAELNAPKQAAPASKR